MEKQKRTFNVDTDGQVKTYNIADPTSEAIRKADWHYAKVYNEALMDGVTTQAEMAELLQKRGITGDKYDKEGYELRTRLEDRIGVMNEESDIVKKKLFAIEVASIRETIFNHNQKLNGPLSNTCERMAEDARVEFLTSTVVEDLQGKKLWGTFDSYRNDPDRKLTSQAKFEVMLWLQGLESNFLEQVPENIVLKMPIISENYEPDRAEAVEEEITAPKAKKVVPKMSKPKTAKVSE